jgi:hypothetical protein
MKIKCIKRDLVDIPLAVPLPMMLDEITTELCVSGDVLDVLVGLKKCSDIVDEIDEVDRSIPWRNNHA